MYLAQLQMCVSVCVFGGGRLYLKKEKRRRKKLNKPRHKLQLCNFENVNRKCFVHFTHELFLLHFIYFLFLAAAGSKISIADSQTQTLITRY